MCHITKCFGRLNKRQGDEIGTFKSPTKPLYIAKQNIEELTLKKSELEKLRRIKDIKEEEIKKYKEEITQEEEMLAVFRELENISNKAKIEEEKIEIYINSKEELEKNKKEIKEKLKLIEPAKEKSKIFKFLYIIPVLFIIISLGLFILINEKVRNYEWNCDSFSFSYDYIKKY